MSAAFNPSPSCSLDHLDPPSPPSPPPLSPLQLIPPPPALPLLDTTEEKQPFGFPPSGRLEDFLESTTGKPLLGVEPGGLSTLIDDLHSQMLCTPSILDRPLSPMDTFDMGAEGEQGLDSMDWLELSMGGERGEDTPTLASLGPQTPTSVFSCDFLDSFDLQVPWEPCL